MVKEYDNENYHPKTLREAVEEFLTLELTTSDKEAIANCPPERLDWLHSYFKLDLQSICLLDYNNIELIADCCPDNPAATADDASRVIMEAVRVFYQTGEYPAEKPNNSASVMHKKNATKMSEVKVTYKRSNVGDEASSRILAAALKPVFEEFERSYAEQNKSPEKDKAE
jgi:hypothetical protein